MAEYHDREHFIPVRINELIDLLANEIELSPPQREPFRRFCQMVTATYHFEFHQHLSELKEAYAPFDPDADTRPLKPFSVHERHQRLDELFQKFVWLMERANYQRLNRDAIEAAMAGGASAWGLNMQVDFRIFERIEIFARGEAVKKHRRKRLRSLWRTEEIELPVFQRLVLILKLQPHQRLDDMADTERVYLKMFKDIPKQDLEMLLPGTQLQMPGFQRLKLGSSMVSTTGFVFYKMAMEFQQIAAEVLRKNPLAFWGPLSLVFGYGYRQYSGYQSTKQNYRHLLTQNLYYQNLDNNAGVLTRLLDAAEEQECREAILAYYFLWQQAGGTGWVPADLDDAIERYLEQRTGLKIDFEIDDALAKLEKLRIVEKVGDRYRAAPIANALEILDYTWDNYFQYNLPTDQARRTG